MGCLINFTKGNQHGLETVLLRQEEISLILHRFIYSHLLYNRKMALRNSVYPNRLESLEGVVTREL